MSKKPLRKASSPAAKGRTTQRKASSRIEWQERTVKVSDLKPYEQNPRRMTGDEFDKLVKHIKEDGYHQRIIVTHGVKPGVWLVVGGHQRIRALKKLGIKQIQVLVPSRPLTAAEFNRILIRDNLPYGSFDFDMLANAFDRDELIDIGMPADWLPGAPKVPEDEEDEEEDEIEPQMINCPKCKHQFSILTKKDEK